jgi:2-polyprenyl-6-methoxyphenol hydroxylase-like FAD-dependent oxidoreductase
MTKRQTSARILVSGASFAGLSTAYWMTRLGYAVTVVEIGKTLKMGGTPVNIEGDTVDIVRRMGLLERIQSRSLPARPVKLVDACGACVAVMQAQAGNSAASAPEYEIERDELLHMQFEELNNDVEFLFGDSSARLEESVDDVTVTFKSGKQRAFSLVFGCDGNHSAVRRMCFGDESAYSRFLQNYFSITIVDKLLIEENTSQIYNVPGKTVMLNAYHGKTDIAFCFFAEEEIAYDYRDQQMQRRMILEHFEGEGWRVPELLEEVSRCSDLLRQALPDQNAFVDERPHRFGRRCRVLRLPRGRFGRIACDYRSRGFGRCLPEVPWRCLCCVSRVQRQPAALCREGSG